MRHIWSSDGKAALDRLLRRRPLLAFDFDGTIAPVVAWPDDAQAPAAIAAVLSALCSRFPVAVVTGRSVQDVKTRLGFTPAYIAGNHGAEIDGLLVEGVDMLPLRELVNTHRGELSDAGVQIEDKGMSLALHYRLAPNAGVAWNAIERFLAQLPEEYLFFGGKQVVNIVGRHAPNKGNAVLSILGASGADCVLFVGDDVNDEAVFECALEDWVTIRVEPALGASRAEYFVDSQQELLKVLEDLLRSTDHLRT